jgi:hypothetical protein
MQVDFSILNQRGTPMFFQDVLANRPAAGTPGRLFVQTDSPFGIYRDTGSAWVNVTPGGGGGGSQDLEQTLFNGSFTENNYIITPLSVDFGIGTGNSVDHYALYTPSASNINYFGSYRITGPFNDGTYISAQPTIFHAHFRTNTGQERTFINFNRSTANADFGFTDITNPVFLRVNHTGTNRNLSVIFNGLQQGINLDFDSSLGKFGNLEIQDFAIRIETDFDDGTLENGLMQTKAGSTNYGWRINRTASGPTIFLGDTQGETNNHYIEISNQTGNTNIQINSPDIFSIVGSASNPFIFDTTTDVTAGGSAEVYWRVQINGVIYKIQLLSDT